MSQIDYVIRDGITGEQKLQRAYALARKIIKYGEDHGKSDADIETALRTCYIESKFGTDGNVKYKPGSPTNLKEKIGIFQYDQTNWNTRHQNLKKWYTDADVQGGNINKTISK